MGAVLRRVLASFALGLLLSLVATGCAEGAPGSERPTGFWPSTPGPEMDAQLIEDDAAATGDAGTPSRDSGSDHRDSGLDGPEGGAGQGGGAQLDGGPSDGATRGDGSTGQQPDASTEPPAEDAGTQDAEPAGCAAGTTECGGACVDLNRDPDHCGACGHVCPGGAACNGSGACSSPSNDCRYEQFEGHDYLFCTDERTWDQARSRCLSWGLDLAIVDREAENAFLTQGQGQWIGMSDQNSQGFRWVPPGDNDSVTGAQLGYANWGEDEPNNTRTCEFFVICRTEDCGELRSDGTWNDRLCNVEQDYTCESF